MTKKEKNFILEEIKRCREYAAEEAAEARKAEDHNERDEHILQERLNDCCANALERLLDRLEEVK